MKKFLVLVALSMCLSVSAQQSFKGKWTARCLYEQFDPGNLRSCDLCPNRMNGDKMDVVPVVMQWTENAVKISIGKDDFTTPYEWNEISKTLRFEVRGIPYVFQLVQGLTDGMMLWKTQEGMLVLLTEEKATGAAKGTNKK